MRSARPVSYVLDEVRSFLPAGWSLADSGHWDAERAVWRAVVRDGAEQDWRLEVRGAEAERAGRLPALREAMDRLYREALG